MLWRESFITTGKKSSSRLSGGLCRCVSFWFWREIGSFVVVAGKFYYNRKKKFKSPVWQVVLLCQFLVLAGNRQFFCCGRKVLLRPEKKVQVICLAGCAVVSVLLLRPEKKDLVVCLAGARLFL